MKVDPLEQMIEPKETPTVEQLAKELNAIHLAFEAFMTAVTEARADRAELCMDFAHDLIIRQRFRLIREGILADPMESLREPEEPEEDPAMGDNEPEVPEVPDGLAGLAARESQ